MGPEAFDQLVPAVSIGAVAASVGALTLAHRQRRARSGAQKAARKKRRVQNGELRAARAERRARNGEHNRARVSVPRPHAFAVDIVADVLILLLLVVVTDFIDRLLPRALPLPLPRPLIQILLGGAVALSGTPVPSFEPEVFFLLFLPPLLFLDGRRIPPEELFQEKGTVVQLALGLVVFTVLGVGTFIHFLLPAMPLSVAFALAAVLSPTDAIAVSDIARRVTMPRRMKRILQGECLLNDASGLVCFRLAVAATLTGAFSLPAAALDFAYNLAAAVVAGVGLTLILSGLKNHVSRHLGGDSGAQILISLLIPFGCWLLAAGRASARVGRAGSGGGRPDDELRRTCGSCRAHNPHPPQHLLGPDPIEHVGAECRPAHGRSAAPVLWSKAARQARATLPASSMLLCADGTQTPQRTCHASPNFRSPAVFPACRVA